MMVDTQTTLDTLFLHHHQCTAANQSHQRLLHTHRNPHTRLRSQHQNLTLRHQSRTPRLQSRTLRLQSHTPKLPSHTLQSPLPTSQSPTLRTNQLPRLPTSQLRRNHTSLPLKNHTVAEIIPPSHTSHHHSSQTLVVHGRSQAITPHTPVTALALQTGVT